MTATALALVRHGQTDWNLQGRIQGSSDVPLNDTGRAQARDAGHSLLGPAWAAIYTSPLSRAMETAQIIAGELGLADPVPVPGIEERSYGDGEGLRADEIEERWGDNWDALAGRETDEELLERVIPALERVAARHPGESIVVVAHGAVIGAVLRHLSDGELPIGPIRNGSAHRVVYDGGLRVG